MKAILNIFRKQSDFDSFSVSLGSKTRTELVIMSKSLSTNEKAHPGMLRMVEKRLAKMDGFTGA